MRVTSKGRYSIQAALDLAFHFSGKPVRLQEISDRQTISIHYLEQIFRRLRKGFVVESTRGPGGGYAFSRAMKEISVKDVLIHAGENIDPALDFKHAVKGQENETLELFVARRFFEELGSVILNYLSNSSLENLIKGAQGNFEKFKARSSQPQPSSADVLQDSRLS